MRKNLFIFLFVLSIGLTVIGLGIINFQPADQPCGHPLEESLRSQAEMEFCILPPGNHSLLRSLLKAARSIFFDSFSVKRLEFGIERLHQVKLHTIFLGQLILSFYIFYQFCRTMNEDEACALPA